MTHDGDLDGSPNYKKILGLPEIIKSASGTQFGLLLDKNGRVYSFGESSNGRIGIPATNPVRIPTLIPNLENVKDFSTFYLHTLVLHNGGNVSGFGYNSVSLFFFKILQYYNLGLGYANLFVNSPQQINIQNIKQLSAGYISSLALNESGSVFGFGYNAVNLKYF
jgi:alpha-tubulin suppressor-like RCC1 family protein